LDVRCGDLTKTVFIWLPYWPIPLCRLLLLALASLADLGVLVPSCRSHSKLRIGFVHHPQLFAKAAATNYFFLATLPVSILQRKATMAASAAAAATSGPTQSDEDRYFSTNPPPKDLEQHMKLVEAFVEKHAKAARRIVLVTSGGTTVSPVFGHYPSKWTANILH
jgi:hypothetical protein